jgi:hypothetical protein
MSPQRLTQIAALGLTFAALAPATVAGQDLRSPDARETAPVAQAADDLRSPDARSHVTPRAAPNGGDLRTPDTRDAGEGRGTFSAPDVMVVKLPQPAPAPVAAADDMDWGDVGIGAAGLLGLAALALAGAFAVLRRRSTVTAA